MKISAGQTVSYLLQAGSGKTVLPSELIEDSANYDGQKYIQLLLDAVAGLLSPVGYDKQELLNELQRR
jgi:DNA polymerase elongation subunit (family B)